MANEKEERLWSAWERSKIAWKVDKFFGRQEFKDPKGNVISKYIWIGRIAIGWYKPLSLDQSSALIDKAQEHMTAPTDSLTQPTKSFWP